MQNARPMPDGASLVEPAADCAASHAAIVISAADGELSLGALIDAAAALAAAGDLEASDILFRTWLAHAGTHPQAFAARFNFAVTLATRGKLRQAGDMLLAALAQKPDFFPAAVNLGSVLDRAEDRVGAIAAWQRITTQLPQIDGDQIGFKTTALNQMARVLETAKVEAPAEHAMRASLEIDPAQREVIQHFVALRQAQCVWPVLADITRLDAAGQMRGASPLSMAALIDDPMLHLASANVYHRNDGQSAGIATVGDWPPPRDRAPRRLRIGYVSSDLREHAVGYLTARIFRLHDRSRVEVFAYYCGPARDDALKVQFRNDADHWRDIATLSDREAACQIVRDGIDILVDVNGYTKDGRAKLFALRPAPIIVNWLGFPGSLGSPHHHYILADSTIIPPQDEVFYSERVLRLPCYQPNDRFRTVSECGQTRAEAGLPAHGIVFCVFNGPHKITPEMFGLWMRILHDTPGSALWMLCDADETRDRLRVRAQSASIAPERLVFAGRMANANHLARYRLADIFLDTAPYGAHTTASDALWMGVPVLTRAGNSFAARVCASLVCEAGIPDMVCEDWAQYHARAIQLATSPEALGSVKARLRAARKDCALFDTEGLVRNLEDRFEQMWREYGAGALPRPRLDRLPFYHRLGCQPARPTLPERDDLLRWYTQELEYRHAIELLPPDTLLWPPRETESPPAQALAA
jgi:predicted O-linked N-acetylglucosamine transferase (SPINDLY family)